MQFQDDDLGEPIYPVQDLWLDGWFTSLKGNSCKAVDDDDIVTVFYRLGHFAAVYYDTLSLKYKTKKEAKIAAKLLVERVKCLEHGKSRPKPKAPDIDWGSIDMSNVDEL